ncbi:hypothetical protein [Catellatospora vulcania]|uniref:hypothetical protein n=1 Tax=Catellatospora vulcania TaxID=1460450 RepID=UPI0012D49541|nr:hypothetical protein [Catellatospora vulcania]
MLLAAATGATLLSVTACGDEAPAPSGDKPPAATTGGGDSGAKKPPLTVTFDVTGAATLKGVVDTEFPNLGGATFPKTCAEYVKGKDDRFVLPKIFLVKLDQGVTPTVNVTLTGYTGPATYDAAAIERKTSSGVEINTLLAAPGGVFRLNGASTSSVKVDTAGGSWTFTGLADSKGGKLAGSVVWKCNR